MLSFLSLLSLNNGATLELLLGSGFDDTDSDSLLHVSDGESTERGEVGEGLDNHGFLGDEVNHSGITGLDEFGLIFGGLTGTFVNLAADLGEFAGDVASVAIEDWCVSVLDLTGVVHDNNLGVEDFSVEGGGLLGVGGDVSSLDVSDGETSDVESDVVTGESLIDLLVMHLDALNFSGLSHGSELGNDTGLHDTGLDTTDGNCTDTGNLVDILEGESEGLVGGSLGGVESIEGLEEVGSLVPSHVGGLFNHVITNPSGNRDELNLSGVVSDLLEVSGKLVLDFFVSLLGVVDGFVVHLVDGDDHLSDTHSLGKEGVLSSLSVLGETSFELTFTSGDHEDGGISLGGTSDHVLDEISVTGGINDGEDTLGGLEFPEGDIDGDTSLSFGLQLVKNPSVLEGSLTHFVGFLFELFNSSFIDTTALVDQVTSGGGFTGIDMTDDDEVESIFLFSHVKFGVLLKLLNFSNCPFYLY
jgi:hypothetical protein